MTSGTHSAHEPVGLTLEEQKKEWSAPTYSAWSTPRCAACGRHHSEPGVTHERAELDCLRRTVKRQRQEIEGLKLDLETLRKQQQIALKSELEAFRRRL